MLFTKAIAGAIMICRFCKSNICVGDMYATEDPTRWPQSRFAAHIACHDLAEKYPYSGIELTPAFDEWDRDQDWFPVEVLAALDRLSPPPQTVGINYAEDASRPLDSMSPEWIHDQLMPALNDAAGPGVEVTLTTEPEICEPLPEYPVLPDLIPEQQEVARWVIDTFGGNAFLPSERALRLLEEALELAQAEGIPARMARRVLARTYKSAPGDPEVEGAQVGFTLLAWAQSHSLNAARITRRELARVQTVTASDFRKRHRVKLWAGLTLDNEEVWHSLPWPLRSLPFLAGAGLAVVVVTGVLVALAI